MDSVVLFFACSFSLCLTLAHFLFAGFVCINQRNSMIFPPFLLYFVFFFSNNFPLKELWLEIKINTLAKVSYSENLVSICLPVTWCEHLFALRMRHWQNAGNLFPNCQKWFQFYERWSIINVYDFFTSIEHHLP